ncbi:uncharacterized protein [Dendrobates tinctorius]|uniref:uncharacterized protein n=1 Tax=Dendrobates tinctorius TaxID=92724 RepID=UPI003CCA2088
MLSTFILTFFDLTKMATATITSCQVKTCSFSIPALHMLSTFIQTFFTSLRWRWPFPPFPPLPHPIRKCLTVFNITALSHMHFRPPPHLTRFRTQGRESRADPTHRWEFFHDGHCNLRLDPICLRLNPICHRLKFPSYGHCSLKPNINYLRLEFLYGNFWLNIIYLRWKLPNYGLKSESTHLKWESISILCIFITLTRRYQSKLFSMNFPVTLRGRVSSPSALGPLLIKSSIPHEKDPGGSKHRVFLFVHFLNSAWAHPSPFFDGLDTFNK